MQWTQLLQLRRLPASHAPPPPAHAPIHTRHSPPHVRTPCCAGGRNLKPGQPLESEEAAAERKQRVATALQGYRKALGLDVDPLVERQAQVGAAGRRGWRG